MLTIRDLLVSVLTLLVAWVGSYFLNHSNQNRKNSKPADRNQVVPQKEKAIEGTNKQFASEPKSDSAAIAPPVPRERGEVKKEPVKSAVITLPNGLPKTLPPPMRGSPALQARQAPQFAEIEDDAITSSDDEKEEGSTRPRVIIISHELPIHLTRDEATGRWVVTEWDYMRNYIANLKCLGDADIWRLWEKDEVEVTFVGYPIVDVPKAEQEQFEQAAAEYNCVPVFMPKELHDTFFHGFCKSCLWPLLHYVTPHANQAFGVQWDEYWKAYNAANMLYCKVASLQIESTRDFIWVHNYHLLLLPSFLRRKLPKAKIGLFIHTPMPTSEVFKSLPSRENILRGMLCADLVGFHTFDYARHFLSSVKRVLDLDFEALPGGVLGINYSGRSVTLRISHVGIPTDNFVTLAKSNEVQRQVQDFRQRWAGRKVILGIDDLDLVKGTILKLQAFARFLDHNPEWRDQVVLVEFIMPSKNAEQEKDVVLSAVLHEVNHIRERHGNDVVELLERQGDGFMLEELVALYLTANVAVLTTVMDGLNLTPYEYTIVQDPEDPGSLVLSEFMGCSRSLSGVDLVNPWCIHDVSVAIYKALSYTLAQRKLNHQRRSKYVAQNTIGHWAVGFLRDLQRAHTATRGLEFVQVGWGSNTQLVALRSNFTHLSQNTVVPSYLKADRRVLVLDYDGTLTSSTDRNACKPSPEVLQALRFLSNDPKNFVFIMSGREKDVLGDWFGSVQNVGLAAEKGVFIRWPKALRMGDSPEWENLYPNIDLSWKSVVEDIMSQYTERTNGSYIEPKAASIVWHFEHTDIEYGKMQANELSKYLQKVIQHEDIDVVKYDFSRIVEVKPRFMSKGHTLRVIIKRLVGSNLLDSPIQMSAPVQASTSPPSSSAWIPLAMSQVPFLICIGDDRSDEEMFRMLHRTQTSVRSPRAGGSPAGSTSPLNPNVYAVCVGMKPSQANYYLHDPAEVLELLSALAQCSRQRLRYNAHSSFNRRRRDPHGFTMKGSRSQTNLKELANLAS